MTHEQDLAPLATIFHCEFNYSLKTPGKDTCKICGMLAKQIISEESIPQSKTNNDKLVSPKTKHEHLEENETTINVLKDDKVISDVTKSTITFDLQKTLLLKYLLG